MASRNDRSKEKNGEGYLSAGCPFFQLIEYLSLLQGLAKNVHETPDNCPTQLRASYFFLFLFFTRGFTLGLTEARD